MTLETQSQLTAVRIRDAVPSDLDAITGIDHQATGIAKPGYWRETYKLYRGRRDGGYILVAETADRPVGFIVGEIRAWEFGSPPCGWVFAIGVDRDHRLDGVGAMLLEALCGRFRVVGVTRLRTMVARDNREVMAFFRSQGMMAGPYQELEKDIQPQTDAGEQQ